MDEKKRKKEARPSQEFRAWFVAQFGKRPTKTDTFILLHEMAQAKYMFERAEERYKKTREWDTKFNACFKAWIAREKP